MAVMTISFRVRRAWIMAAGFAWMLGIRGPLWESLVNRAIHIVSD